MPAPVPCIALTLNGGAAARLGMEVLLRGGSALDAVEAGTRAIEDNPDDWSVGYGGFPNLAGEVELDASIMDGRTLAAGAVAGVRRHRNPVTIARRVMERTPHVLLAGEGADLFAEAEGFPREELLTDRVREAYRAAVRDEPVALWPRVPEESEERARAYGEKLREAARERKGWREVYCAELQGTCDVIALDRGGALASAVSTSGLALKLPGRVGDTPVIGAGNYCDGRFGAAGCAGNGELCMVLGSARAAVGYMGSGLDPRAAAERAVRDFAVLPVRRGGFQVLVLSPQGVPWCASNIKVPEFWFMSEGNAGPRRLMGSYVEVQSSPALV